jgi:ectoine hydroxylase-related dioxygenase (phytanoyl-CoA dioxygenase family)
MRERFLRDGVLFPIPVLTAKEIARYRAEVEALEREAGEPVVRRSSLHESSGWALDLMMHSRVVDAVSEILGPEVISWGTLLLRKQPRDPSFVAWHQDGHYADFLDGAPALSAWIALSDSTAANGCMRVVPGSHRRRLEHAERHAPGNLLLQGQEIAAEVDESEAVDVVLKAGEMSLHDFNLVHGSRGNPSAAPRTGFIVRYTTPAAGTPATATFVVRR